MNEKKLKILQLGKFYPIRGGVEKVMYDLMNGLSEKGVDCDMICAVNELPAQIIKLNSHARLICCKALTKVAATMISPSMIWLLRKVSKNYDIIHVHHPDPMAALALFLSGYKGKIVLHWHSDIQKQRYLLKLYLPLQTWLLKRADLIVGTTPVYLKESPYLTSFQNKTVCLPIGIVSVDPDQDEVRKLQEKYPNKKIVFSLGRLVEYKGYTYLIDAAKYLNDDYVILIGGEGALKDELQTQINLLGLQHKVFLLGRISDKELPTYYGACRLFCMSSVMKTEAFGIVQIEAMSCGKPVIATNIPQSGVSWVNAHGISGLNVEPRNAKALATAISAVGDDDKKYMDFSLQAKLRFNQVFRKNLMIKNMLEIYNRL